MLLQDWIGSRPNFALPGEQLVEMDRLSYLDICILLGDLMSDKVSSHIQKVLSVFTNLRHLCRRRDIRLLICNYVYGVSRYSYKWCIHKIPYPGVSVRQCYYSTVLDGLLCNLDELDRA